ncbi:MAG: folylpolyglutamate synthase/dihydrofolate synthase family protein [Candidatus Undinarchaeales archaeon]
MKYKDAVQYIKNLEKIGSKLGLSRVKELLSFMENPQNSFKTIHVAGTNGKGSTCAMVSSILKEADYKTALYTSPELTDVRERIQVNENLISKKKFAELVEKYKEKRDEIGLTQFEFLTALAFKYFELEEVEYAVIEAGMGGRLDATNIVFPVVSVITNIDLEHTDQLGGSIEEIAREKAGIVKEKVPIVLGAGQRTLTSIYSIAKERKAPLYIVGGKYSGPLGLKGEFQRENAALAVEAVKRLKLGIKAEDFESALKKVEWPGVFDLRKWKGKRILLDTAHNPAGVKTLIRELDELKYDKLIVLFGVLEDKDYGKMVKKISEKADELVFTEPENERALNPKELAEISKGEVIADAEEAFNSALKLAGKKDLVLVAGSHYLVGPVSNLLE